MTTIESPDGPSEVITARRTESLDAPAILKLVQPTTDALFGRVNIVNLIEKSVLAVTLSNDKDEVLGHAALYDYPNVAEVDSADWESWINKFYDCTKCNSLNTLFMHYFVAKPEYSHGCAREIIRTMFNAVPDLHYCFLVVPMGVFPESSLAELFLPLEKFEDSKGPKQCAVFSCSRHDHVPVLHVRDAMVEDNDDLAPLFNKQSEVLKETYGDYFLAEMIEAQDENMKCIVAEVDGLAVGFMSVCTDVNVELLNECYELGPYHGLRKPHEQDDLSADKKPLSIPSTPKDDSSRPSSKLSDKSKKSGTSNDNTKSSTTLKESRADTPTEDPKIKPKLSDSQVGTSHESILIDNTDEEAAKDEAEERELSEKLPSLESEPTDITTSKTPRPLSPRVMLPTRFVPIYRGDNLSVCIQLFCIDERYEMRSSDFLAKVFELFPGFEFIIITVPHLVPEFPLLQRFVRIPTRCPSTLANELYVFTRSGLLTNFQIRTAKTVDTANIEKLVKELELNEAILKDLKQFNAARRDNDGTGIKAYVAEVNEQIVGVAVTRREVDIEHIRSHYNIEDFIYFNHHRREEHAHLHHYALNPIFKHYSKHFLKEILRLDHKTCLYYPLYPAYVDKEILESHSLVAALQDVVPVRARRQIAYPLDKLGENAPSQRVLQNREIYALNHINRKLTMEPKVTINARIVVVGASDVGIAFLETFAFCPHLKFNNLTLISPHGLPGQLPPDAMRDSMLGHSKCYTQEEYAQMSLRSWVNVVYGKVTKIDRRKRHIVVNHRTLVPYDHVIMATGTQYQIPCPTGANIDKDRNNTLPERPDRRYSGTIPKNAFVINDSYEAAVALYWAEHNILETEGQVIVYGNTVDAYCCVQALLEFGINGNRIFLVEPPSTNETSCFNNPSIDSSMKKFLKEQGVKRYSGYILATWNDDVECEEIESATFTSDDEPLQLDCSAFFCYYKQEVDYLAFKALNDACLVYDGRLVIDSNFHTNDITIRAAGSLTKFKRSFHADKWTHTNFNSKEVGIQLASSMLSLFDPTLEPEAQPPEDLLKLIPLYRTAKIIAGTLPGGYHYLHVAKPGLHVPLEDAMYENDYGRELITGKPGGEKEYFRLHINQYSAIETITCVSKKPFAESNIICLYGVHERYLNNMVSRFDEGLIDDFYSYFQETWCLSIFHDRFADFREEVRELLISRPAENVQALEEKVREMIEEDLKLKPSQRKYLSDEYSTSGAKRAVETRLLSFLNYNYYHLPMYAKQGMV